MAPRCSIDAVSLATQEVCDERAAPTPHPHPHPHHPHAAPGHLQRTSRLLRPDVRLPGLDHRLRLAAGRAERGRGRRTGVDHLVDPGRRDAHGAGPGLRRARGAYPVAGGTGRFPYFSHGPLAGFTAGWASWLQAVAIAPIEILAAITYVNSIKSVNENFPMLHADGPKRRPAQRDAGSSSPRSRWSCSPR